MEYAERLARGGYDLVLVARRRERLSELAERLRRDNGIQAEVICTDLTDPQDLAKVETRVSSDEALNLLINNAGFPGYKPFVSIDPKAIDVTVHACAAYALR
jgi:short-subunit dehydrogenase